MSVQEKRRIEILLAHCSSPAEAGKIVPELLERVRNMQIHYPAYDT